MSEPLHTVMAAGQAQGDIDALLSVTQKLGYVCLSRTNSASSALQPVAQHKPQMLLLHLQSAEKNILESIKQIAALNSTAIAVWADEEDFALVPQAMDIGAGAFLLPPFDIRQVRAVLEAGWHRFQTLRSLQAELDVLKDNLETRKLIDRAKGILMQARGISEPEAYRLLQRMTSACR